MKRIGFVTLIFYFVTMVVAPSYATKGTYEDISYDIVIDQWGVKVVSVMDKELKYDVYVTCENNKVPVNSLELSLPPQFEFLEGRVEDVRWPWPKNWVHIFSIKTPSQEGEYLFLFTGEDINGNKIDLEIPVTVKHIDAYDELVNSYPPALVFIGGLIVTLSLVAWTGIFGK